jgi:hypothetical protein
MGWPTAVRYARSEFSSLPSPAETNSWMPGASPTSRLRTVVRLPLTLSRRSRDSRGV